MAFMESGLRTGPGTIYTIGYEGRTPEAFSLDLETNGIRRLIDVREIAFSRKPGFSSGRLSQFLAGRGIEYIHIRVLGSPKAIRDEFKHNDDFDSFADAYRRHLVQQTESLNLLLESALEKPTAIMCFERDPARCHRSIIASELQEHGLSVKNL